MTSPFVLGLNQSSQPNQTQARLPVPKMRATSMAAPISAGVSSGKKPYNPFLSVLDTSGADFRDTYGVNRPLREPMFLGYRNDQPIYGGGRLFLLY